MTHLTDDMIRVVEEQRLGFVATVAKDGLPNLSPKGTMVVVDNQRIAFGHIRSPNTVVNIDHQPIVEINFVDPLARKGYRFRGEAKHYSRDSMEFLELRPLFDRWGELSENILEIVVVKVDRALPITTPAYDIGMTEKQLRAQWAKHYSEIGCAAVADVHDS